MDELTAVLNATRAALEVQGELGLQGVSVPEACFLDRSPVEISLRSRRFFVQDKADDAGGVGSQQEEQRRHGQKEQARGGSLQPENGLDRSVQVIETVAPSDASLGVLRADIGDCQRCKLSSERTRLVFGVGDPKARLMFVGEAPGRAEDLQGEPFVGASGQLLTRMIRAMGFEREQVYIANIVKCRPPRDRDPEADEIEQCEPFLKRQIALVGPEVIVALGRVAVQTLLRDPTAISRQRGRWRTYQGIDLMPTFHPAYLLRNSREKRTVWEDLKKVVERLN